MTLMRQTTKNAAGWLAGRLLVDWLAAGCADWLSDWLAVWLTGWLAAG
jgi:hypothetical protein